MTERCSCQETVTSLQEELGLPTSEPAQASKGRLAGAQHLRIIGERPWTVYLCACCAQVKQLTLLQQVKIRVSLRMLGITSSCLHTRGCVLAAGARMEPAKNKASAWQGWMGQLHPVNLIVFRFSFSRKFDCCHLPYRTEMETLSGLAEELEVCLVAITMTVTHRYLFKHSNSCICTHPTFVQTMARSLCPIHFDWWACHAKTGELSLVNAA